MRNVYQLQTLQTNLFYVAKRYFFAKPINNSGTSRNKNINSNDKQHQQQAVDDNQTSTNNTTASNVTSRLQHIKAAVAKNRQYNKQLNNDSNQQHDTIQANQYNNISYQTTDNDQQIVNIPYSRIRTHHTGDIDKSIKPSDYIKDILLTIHPDIILSKIKNIDDNDIDYITVIKQVNNKNNHSNNDHNNYIKGTLIIEDIKLHNTNNLAILNSILDYNKQFDNNNNNTINIKPPQNNTKLSFYSLTYDNTAVRYVELIYKLPTSNDKQYNNNNVPTIIIQDSIEYLIYKLLIATYTIDISDELISYWKQSWYKHQIQYDFKRKTHNNDYDTAYSTLFSHNSITQQQKAEKMFLESFRSHSSSVIPGLQHDINNISYDYDIYDWASKRPRYTLCSMMQQANLIEFDHRLTAEQQIQAIQMLSQSIQQYFKKLQCNKWLGIGICFVPSTSNTNDTDIYNKIESDYEQQLIHKILKQTDSIYDSEWNFIQRPGWWLIPYNFTTKQLIEFAKIFLYANKVDDNNTLGTSQSMLEQ